MSLPVKLGLATASLSVAGGLGYLGTTYFKNNETIEDIKPTSPSISELINKEYKFKLLDTTAGDNEDKEYWKTNWNNYKTANDAAGVLKDTLGLKGWVKSKTQDLTEELKKECKKLSDADFINESDASYVNVTKYCTRGVTVKEDAEKKNKEILNTKDPSTDSKAWTQRHTSRSNLKAHLVKLGVPTERDEQITADAIKKGCADSISKNKKDDQNYEEIYTSYEKVCTKQQGDS